MVGVVFVFWGFFFETTFRVISEIHGYNWNTKLYLIHTVLVTEINKEQVMAKRREAKTSVAWGVPIFIPSV